MKYTVLISLGIFCGCSAIPFIAEDVKELIEIEEEKEIGHDVHSKRETMMASWYWEETVDAVEEEKYKEKVKQYNEYYRYHFGDFVNKTEYALRLKKQKWPWGVC